MKKLCKSVVGLKLHKLKKHGAERCCLHIIEFSVEKLLIEACNKEREKEKHHTKVSSSVFYAYFFISNHFISNPRKICKKIKQLS